MTVQEIMVPASKAGLVIGKGGETIKSLQVSVKLVSKNPNREVVLTRKLKKFGAKCSQLIIFIPSTCRKEPE